MMSDEDPLYHARKVQDGDALSCCNIPNHPQILLGSSTSSNAANSMTTCSISSRSLNFSSLE